MDNAPLSAIAALQTHERDLRSLDIVFEVTKVQRISSSQWGAPVSEILMILRLRLYKALLE
jgi:hypothetical protein